jgi:hypothetical protein
MGKPTPDPWIARETLRGRWRMLPRPRKAAVALGALLLVSGLACAVALLVSSSPSSGAETTRSKAPGAGVRDAAPNPSLVLPTEAPAQSNPSLPADTPTPSHSTAPRPSASSTRSAERGGAHVSGSGAKSEPSQYSVWAGHGCSSGASAGYSEYGRYYGGIEGWYTVDHGGYGGGSCDGSYSAVPMSGSRTQDNDNEALWWWSVGRAYDTCSIGVFVPDGDSRDVGGNPTTYRVLSDPQEENSAYAGFQIDQRSNRGSLVDAGTYQVKDGRIAVRMLDRGQDWDDSGPTYAHHAAAQMKVTCQAHS